MTARTARRSAPIALLVLGLSVLPAAAADWRSELQAWKIDRDEKLRRPDGWLSLVGLAWLAEGENPVGSDPESAVRLPDGHAPGRLGTIRLVDRRLHFEAAPGAEVTVDELPISSVELATDHAESGPTVVRHGSVSFYAIGRNGRLAVRIKDSEAETRTRFRGLDYYPVDARWRVQARFEAAPPGTTFEVPNALGYVEQMEQPGWLDFELDGATHRLIALDDTGDGRLFLVFGDRTNGRETYGGGRFVYTDPPVDGRTTIDFNRAYNPPCVFTPYATCPLPPRGNKIPLPIEAGEKKYAGAWH